MELLFLTLWEGSFSCSRGMALNSTRTLLLVVHQMQDLQPPIQLCWGRCQLGCMGEIAFCLAVLSP